MFGRGKNHLSGLPIEAIAQTTLSQKAEQRVVGPEKDVQPTLDPITIGILPGGHLAAWHGTLFQNNNVIATVV